LSLVGSATLFALAPGNTPQPVYEQRGPSVPDRSALESRKNDSDGGVQLPSGQYVTPTAIQGAEQQYLNPQLPDYPEFIAGMAVRSQLSPDGTTLAVITAGQNSLYRPDGTVDTANSTQYVFIYEVTTNTPVVKQVIKQANAHVGLVFAPDGNTLYAAGGNDDVVHVYEKTATGFTAATPIALGHLAPGATGSARNRGIGVNVQPNAGGMDLSADGATLVVANNYNDSIGVIDTKTRTVRYEHDLRPFFPGQRGAERRHRGHLSVRGRHEGEPHGIRVVEPRS
jgi:hypothetical protein